MRGEFDVRRGVQQNLLHGRVNMRRCIHSRTFASVLRLPEEEEIYVGRHECYRYVGDSALLHNAGCDKFWSRNELSSNTESTTRDSDSEAN